MPIDQAVVLRDGGDVVLLSWGAMLSETLAAADVLASEGIDAGVIDLVSLKPIDRATIRAAVAHTGRCVIVHEAPRSVGVGAEIAADLAEHCLTRLLAPVRRVTGYDTVMPYPRLEKYYMPGTVGIVAAVRETMAYA